jgi:hypothetical protein
MSTALDLRHAPVLRTEREVAARGIALNDMRPGDLLKPPDVDGD